MDEDEILQSLSDNNIPNSAPDLEKCFHNLTTSDVQSTSQFHNSLKEEEDDELLRRVSDLLSDSSDDKFSNSMIKDADVESENYDINRCEVLNGDITLMRESVASNSTMNNKILIEKDLEIPLDKENKIVFNKDDENREIQSFIEPELSEFDSKTSSDEVGIVNENSINGEETFTAKSNRDDSVSNILAKVSDNEEEETIFNSDNQIRKTEINDPLDFHEKVIKVEDESLKVEKPDLNSSDNLIFSKPVADFSTTRTNVKPNSLAEDAKLVKFSVSAKSVNIMQSNAQFLNKSRNFINFITEKSTNIMEKTLLPQNLAAKYNSMIKMTENNPPNGKKLIQERGSSSDNNVGVNLSPKSNNSSENNDEKSKEIVNNVTELDTEDTDNDNSCIVVGNCDSENKDCGKEDENLFLKCSINENISDLVSTRKRKDSEATSSNSFHDMNIENIEKNSNPEKSNSIEKEKMNKCDTRDKISTMGSEKIAELYRGDESTDNLKIGKEDSMKKHEINDWDSGFKNKSNAMISSGSESPSISLSNQEKIKYEQDDRVNSKERLIDHGLLAHPAYITLLRDYSNLKENSKRLSEVKVKTEMENQRLLAENSGELYALQLETLEKTIEHLRNDLKQANASQELINREYILANKERESMVMKYAISEKQLIDTQRAREYAERKINEALKEQELLHTKLKQVQGERTRICNILDIKCHELTDAQKEIDRLKEELSMREVKLKWTQNKLKTELEMHKENQQKLDKAMLRINEMKEECDQVRKESQETIRKFQQSEENKVVTLDHQLKEQQARLILERHVTEDKESSRLQLQKEVETLKNRQHVLIEENNTLSLKVQNFEKERLNYENNLSSLKVLADQRQKEIVDLVGRVSELETLKLQLKHKEELLSSTEAEVERLRQSNTELQSDMECCREREAHMLEFTQKLTDKNVRLQSEFTSMEAKNEQLELEQGPLQEEIKELLRKVKSLEVNLASEKSKRTEECELLARHVAEQTQLARNLSQKLEDSQGENSVLRRKQQISVKEMTKELQQCKKRLDAFETVSPSNSIDRTSRTGSSSSLSTGETLNGGVSDNSNSGGDNILQSVEPDRQTLIDRIVKLQRIRVRQAEKLDFLEEHTRTLVNELQKKTKIIKNYILHENPDAMGSNERDRNKAELARHGGIMASVYNQRVSDDNMTLELSLEINQKLQAVLEDTLLKNITLKDSIDTLGGEIARLTMQNQRRQ